MTARTPPRTSVPRPSSLVPRAPVGHDDSACRTFVSRPPPPGRVSKGGQRPPFGRFKGVWGEIRNPPRIFLRGSGGVFFQFGKNTSPDAAKHPWHPWPVGQPPRRGRKPPIFIGSPRPEWDAPHRAFDRRINPQMSSLPLDIPPIFLLSYRVGQNNGSHPRSVRSKQKEEDFHRDQGNHGLSVPVRSRSRRYH